MTDAPGADCFRDTDDYRRLRSYDDGKDHLDEAIETDTGGAMSTLEAERGEVDSGGLMEAFARHGFGGDLRDAAGWRTVALSGELPRAWSDAVEEVVEG